MIGILSMRNGFDDTESLCSSQKDGRLMWLHLVVGTEETQLASDLVVATRTTFLNPRRLARKKKEAR